MRELQLASITLMLISGYSCFAINDEDQKAIEQSVHANDPKKLIAVIGSKPNNSTDYSCYLDSAIEESLIYKANNCNTEIVKTLIEKGAAVTEFRQSFEIGGLLKSKTCEAGGELSKAVKSGCVETLRILAAKLDEEQIESAAPETIWKVARANDHDKNVSPDLINARGRGQIETIPIFKSLLAPICEKQGPQSKACIGIKNLEAGLEEDKRSDTSDANRAKRMSSKKTKFDANELRAKAESPEGIRDRACENLNSLATIEAAQARERRISKESGIINKTAKYELAQAKIGSQDELIKLKSQFKNQTGHALNLTDCPKQSSK